jgi:hypothetical protein
MSGSTSANRWLRQALVEAAWASSHTKDTSLGATYQRIKGRRGGKRACLAVGHRILRMAYALLTGSAKTSAGP